jgi:hypothetical protein
VESALKKSDESTKTAKIKTIFSPQIFYLSLGAMAMGSDFFGD